MNKINLLSNTIVINYTDTGEGKTFLFLHPGGGRRLMQAFCDDISLDHRVVFPVHPGFDGTERPGWCFRVSDIATAYIALIEYLKLEHVILVGNSIGGWVAAEIACRNPKAVEAIVLMNAIGLPPAAAYGQVTDPKTIPMSQRFAYQYHDPARFIPTTFTEKDEALMRSNMRAMDTYLGDSAMSNPFLPELIKTIAKPVHILWGESDRIAPRDYGKQFADLIPGATFRLIERAGHYPHLEQPEIVRRLLKDMFN